MKDIFLGRFPPLERITNFLRWVQQFQRDHYWKSKRVLGWPVSMSTCFARVGNEPVCEKLCAIESAECSYFEAAIREAFDTGMIEPCEPAIQAMSLHGTVRWVLGRARLLNSLDQLKSLSAFSNGLLAETQLRRRRP